MRKIISVVLTIVVLAGVIAVPAAAGKKKQKKPTTPYTSVLTYTRPALGSGGIGLGTEPLTLSSTATHTYVSIKVADDVSPMGNVTLGWDTDGDTVADQAIAVCGATTDPLKVPASTTFTVFPWLLPSPDCPTGFSTSGTITATFSVTP